MLNELITRASLEEAAGAAVFQRGVAYFADAAVGRLLASDEMVAAQVEGSAIYRVELWAEEGDLAYDCTCPHALDGYFCKHCVAVGLAWLAENSVVAKTAAALGKKKRRDPWQDIGAYLKKQSPENLVELLLDVAQRDDRLYQSLLLKAEQVVGGAHLEKAFRRAIDDATRVRNHVDWREAASFAGNIDQVVDSLAELLKPETAATLVELAEYAIERIEDALERIDDSSGQVGATVSALGELHLKACAIARAASSKLAERLFRLETTLPFGIWSFDVATYGDVLGKGGLRRYREVAETEWRKFKSADAKEGYDPRRATLTRIMVRLAEMSGDVEALVAIKSQDLSSAYRYLDIAEIWSAADQPNTALEWAERGLKAFPERPDNRLRDFLVAAYLKCKRNDEALQLTWVQFEEQPILEHYKKLSLVAGELGLWPVQRQRALAWLAGALVREAGATSRWKPKPSTPDYSLRVEIALWEEDMDAAWVAAHEGMCNRGLLITLAGKLESSRPLDAISLYRRVVPPIVEQTNNTAYADAIKLICRLGGVMNAHDQSPAFTDYLAALRAQFKPKRNFIKLLDGVRH